MTTAIESIISGISQMIGVTWDLYPGPLILGIVIGIIMFVSFFYYEFDQAIPMRLTLILAIVVSLFSLFIFTAEDMCIYILIILNTFASCLLFSVLFCLCGFIRYCVIIFDIRKYLKKQVKK